MHGLHENQQKILTHLLGLPEGATLDELVEYLGITKTAVKEHINRIADLGYLSHVDTKGSVGRPRRRYLLSEQGIEAFPKKYSWLSNVILSQLAKEFTPERAVIFMQDLADNVSESFVSQFQKIENENLRLKKVTEVLNELGYRAILKQSGGKKEAIIEAVNCVYHSVAKEHPSLCQFDIRLIENTSKMNVKLETCIARGGATCRFCISKK